MQRLLIVFAVTATPCYSAPVLCTGDMFLYEKPENEFVSTKVKKGETDILIWSNTVHQIFASAETDDYFVDEYECQTDQDLSKTWGYVVECNLQEIYNGHKTSSRLKIETGNTSALYASMDWVEEWADGTRTEQFSFGVFDCLKVVSSPLQ